jgi:ABC-type polysaccharide/polyol phosphate export permease
MNNLQTLLRYRELGYLFTWREIRIRYKQSVMGFLWAIFMPALIVGAGALVRVVASKWSGRPLTAQDIASVIVRAVIWAFFVSSIRFGTSSLTQNSNLVTKIAFPKELFPIASVMSSLFDFAVASVVVAICLPILGVTFHLEALWSIPLMLVTILLVIGLTLILSASNLFFRDVKYLVEIFLTYAIFFTPVLYPASMAGQWRPLLYLNPVSPLLEATADAVVLGSIPDLPWVGYSVVSSLALFAVGYSLFKQLEASFAERI